MQGNKGITRDVLEEHAAYQGYMLKQENKYKNKILNGILRSKAWYRYYCIIYDNHLYCFKNQYAKDHLIDVALKGSYSSAFEQPDKTSEFIFVLKSKLPILPDHIFLTETKYEMKKWLAVIHDEINKTDEIKPIPKIVIESKPESEEQYVPIISDSDDDDSDSESSQADVKESKKDNALKTRCGTRKLPGLPLGKYRVDVLKQNQAMIKQLNDQFKTNTSTNTNSKEANKEAIKQLSDAAKFFWDNIWWESDEDPNEHLTKFNQVGVYLVRRSSRDKTKYVLVVFQIDKSEPLIMKYSINETVENGEKLYFLESKQQFLSIEEMCEYYHKNVLPADASGIKTKLEVPLNIKLQKK